jgi:hypothetical protein
MKQLRLAFVGLASLATLLSGANRASAQQGPYITQASARLGKLVDKGNDDGYNLHNNSFSIGGGWLKKSKEWVAIYTVQLTAGKKYRFLASGDDGAIDVDLRVKNADGDVKAKDDLEDKNAVVNYTPKVSGRHTVEIRLYDSTKNRDSVVLSVVMSKQ